MEHLGIPCDVRDPDNEVTANDLTTHDILIVGWNYDGNVSGLDNAILSAGIIGRVILSGHDLDYHTVHETNPDHQQAAETMLIQAIGYVLEGVDLGMGTGMITLGCTYAFPYLPEEWGVDPSLWPGELVTEFTSEGLASGVYDGLTPDDMCGWGKSYHDVLPIGPDSDFVEFELGSYSADDIITVARISCGIELTKTDDIDDWDCVEPDDYVNYTIS